MQRLSQAGILVTALLLLLADPTAYAEPPDPANHARVGAKVYEGLAQAGSVRVMIVLSIPVTQAASRERMMSDVSRAQSAVLNALSRDQFTLGRRFQAIPALAGEITSKGLQTLLTLPGVLAVDEDAGGRGGLLQSVPLIRADAVQALGFTGQGVTVAILDSGIDTDHSDLGNDLVAEACFCSGSGTGGPCCPDGSKTQMGPGAAEDDNGHGSNVAGIVTSSGIVSPTGVAPDAGIVAIKVLDQNNVFCCTSDIVAGLDWIIANRPDVDIVNMSLGTFDLFPGECDTPPVPGYIKPLATAIDTLRSLGVLTFASAANDASGTEMSAPACVANAVSVGAVYDANIGPVGFGDCFDSTTAADQVACFSNSNETTDLFAPGAAITSDYLFNTISTYYGTSQASPHAAGCAADFLQADPSLTPDDIETALKLTGIPVTDPKNGLTFPRIDCLQALASLESMALCGNGVIDAAAEECDDGNVVAGDGCSPTCKIEGAARMLSCVGFEPPMDRSFLPAAMGGGEIAKTVKTNRALPFKAKLVDAAGSVVTDLVSPPVIQVIFDADMNPVSVDVTDDALSPGKGSDTGEFELSGDTWQYNLGTRNYTEKGGYTATMESGDPSEYILNDPTCQGLFEIE